MHTRNIVICGNARRKAFGFSLVELLVVIGIIAVLAVLAQPVLNRMRSQAEATTCRSNLRQIGMAISLYSGEHAGLLPGPLLPSQGPRYNTVEGLYTAYLANYLYPYLGIPEPTRGALPVLDIAKKTAGVLYCPAFGKVAANNFANSYLMRWQIEGMGQKSPWGSSDITSTPQIPKSILSIPNPSATWAISDIDQQSPTLPTVSWMSNLPPGPIHLGSRNALFFDGHVGRIDKDGTSL